MERNVITRILTVAGILAINGCSSVRGPMSGELAYSSESDCAMKGDLTGKYLPEGSVVYSPNSGYTGCIDGEFVSIDGKVNVENMVVFTGTQNLPEIDSIAREVDSKGKTAGVTNDSFSINSDQIVPPPLDWEVTPSPFPDDLGFSCRWYGGMIPGEFGSRNTWRGEEIETFGELARRVAQTFPDQLAIYNGFDPEVVDGSVLLSELEKKGYTIYLPRTPQGRGGCQYNLDGTGFDSHMYGFDMSASGSHVQIRCLTLTERLEAENKPKPWLRSAQVQPNLRVFTHVPRYVRCGFRR